MGTQDSHESQTLSSSSDPVDVRYYMAQPGVLVPSTEVVHQVPYPEYTPWLFDSIFGRSLQDKFRWYLRRATGREPRLVTPLFPASGVLHLRSLKDQLERNNLEPVLDLGRTPEGDGRIYGYLIEATPSMMYAFDHFRPEIARFALLETHAGPFPHINVIGYWQAHGSDLRDLRAAFARTLGHATFRLDDVLRRVPYP